MFELSKYNNKLNKKEIIKIFLFCLLTMAKNTIKRLFEIN